MTDYSNDDRIARQIEIDRLVDGELDDRSRRQLLASLDARPECWRQLALAFVESQTLTSDLQAWAASDIATKHDEESADVTPVRPERSSEASSRKISGIVFVLSMAASFLIAFGIALWFRAPQEPAGNGNRQAADIGTKDSTDGGTKDSTKDIVTSGRSLTVPEVAVDSVVRDSVVKDGVDPLLSPVPIPDTANVATQRAIEVPVIAVGNAGDNWQSEIGSALPKHVVESLQRTGYQIESHRGFHTIQLQDGRRVVIPVEQVDVEFMGRQVHQ